MRLLFARAPDPQGRDDGGHGQPKISQARLHPTACAWLRGRRRKVNAAAVGGGAFHALVTLHSSHPSAPKPRAARGIPALGPGCVSAHPFCGIVFQQCVLGAGCTYSRAWAAETLAVPSSNPRTVHVLCV